MKRFAAFVLISALLAAPAAALAYSDNVGEEAVRYNILYGFEDGSLRLEDNITRAQMAKTLCTVLLEDESEADAGLTDIGDHWAKGYIAKASMLGLVNGFEDNTFRPDEELTLELAVKMIVGNGSNASYPADHLAFALEHGLLDNVDALTGETVCRGDAAQIFLNAIHSAEDGDFASDAVFKGAYRLHSLFGPVIAPLKAKSTGGGGASGASTPMVLPGAAPETNTPTTDQNSYYSPYMNPERNGEEYSSEEENSFKSAAIYPLSTFSIDTDTASYSNIRRLILNGRSIPEDAVRTEEIINYFDYDLPQPTDGTPFSVTSETAKCPWNDEHLLTMINVQGGELTERQPQSLVFLIDVSGSMANYNKLPLIKRSMRLLLEQLDERDTISIVTYAGEAETVSVGLSAADKDKLTEAIDSLQAYGATNGEGGLELAYAQAESLRCDGNNRVILCSDGDFNVGASDDESLARLIESKRDNGIFLSVLGFGMGNYKDSKMELLADKGDGGCYYIDNLREAKKVLCNEMTSTLCTIAKDVKIQTEFDPSQVSEYRLIGYENRRLENNDFADDSVDAGEIGAGASVTALYEIIPAEGYSTEKSPAAVRLRYKQPEGGESILKEYPVSGAVSAGSENLRFASAAAEIGMLLSKSEYAGTSSYDSVIGLARNAYGNDRFGIRHEFVQLMDILRARK